MRDRHGLVRAFEPERRDRVRRWSGARDAGAGPGWCGGRSRAAPRRAAAPADPSGRPRPRRTHVRSPGFLPRCGMPLPWGSDRPHATTSRSSAHRSSGTFSPMRTLARINVTPVKGTDAPASGAGPAHRHRHPREPPVLADRRARRCSSAAPTTARSWPFVPRPTRTGSASPSPTARRSKGDGTDGRRRRRHRLLRARRCPGTWWRRVLGGLERRTSGRRFGWSAATLTGTVPTRCRSRSSRTPRCGALAVGRWPRRRPEPAPVPDQPRARGLRAVRGGLVGRAARADRRGRGARPGPGPAVHRHHPGPGYRAQGLGHPETDRGPARADPAAADCPSGMYAVVETPGDDRRGRHRRPARLTRQLPRHAGCPA